MPRWAGRWKGGRTYTDRDGQTRYVIEKMRRGQRYAVTLPPGVASPDAELALFLRDPDGYAERSADTGLRPQDGAVLTRDEVKRFREHQTQEQLSDSHVAGTAGYLEQWVTDLEGRDLRRVPVDDLYTILGRYETARYYRATALKAYCTWLVARQRLPLENSARLLRVKPNGAARLRGLVGYTAEQIETFYAAISNQRVRDVFLIAAKCGMHGTEVQRIARGDVEITEIAHSRIAAVLRFWHKSGRDHRQSIDAQTLAAVRRLRATGAPCKEQLHEAIHATARRLQRPPVFLRYLRHSWATLCELDGEKVTLNGSGRGMSRSDVAAAAGHRTGLMIQDHYNNAPVPFMAVPPLTLRHAEDPVALAPSAERAAL